MEINGQRVGDQVFTPGWTSYRKRLQYQTYDVTALLQSGSGWESRGLAQPKGDKGENAFGAMLGDGWYRGYIAFRNRRNLYGDKLALLLQLQIVYEDGRVQIVSTDENWRSSTGPLLKSDIYNGESYDARLEKVGWSHLHQWWR